MKTQVEILIIKTVMLIFRSFDEAADVSRYCMYS